MTRLEAKQLGCQQHVIYLSLQHVIYPVYNSHCEEEVMRRTAILQEIRIMRFEEAYGVWTERRLTEEEASRMLVVYDRTFRCYIHRYEERGLDGLLDKRLAQASSRCAPVDEVIALARKYEGCYRGWSVKHFHSWYRRDGGSPVTPGSRTHFN